MADVHDKLKESARDALMEIAKLVTGGGSGKIEMDYSQGGIRNLRVTKNVPVGKEAKKRNT